MDYTQLMIDIDFSEINKLELQLEILNSRAMPFATKNTLNEAAFKAREIAQKRIKDTLINRNQFTQRSVKVQKTNTLRISEQMSIVGSTQDYMERQEFGGIKVKKGKRGTPIATSYSAGQPQDTIPRTKLPTRSNKLRNINITKNKNPTQGRLQRNFIAIYEAARTKRSYIFLNLARSQGIFKVIGGAKKPRIKMIHDLSNKAVVIPAKPWLRPSVEEVKLLIAQIHIDSLQFQIDRLQLFRDK